MTLFAESSILELCAQFSWWWWWWWWRAFIPIDEHLEREPIMCEPYSIICPFHVTLHSPLPTISCINFWLLNPPLENCKHRVRAYWNKSSNSLDILQEEVAAHIRACSPLASDPWDVAHVLPLKKRDNWKTKQLSSIQVFSFCVLLTFFYHCLSAIAFLCLLLIFIGTIVIASL